MRNVNYIDNDNPPPFHLNVNNHLLYNRLKLEKNQFYEPYVIPNYNIQQKNGNDKSKSKDKNKNKYRESFNLEENTEEGKHEKNKSKKNNNKKADKNRFIEDENEDDMSINIDIINKKKVNLRIPKKIISIGKKNMIKMNL